VVAVTGLERPLTVRSALPETMIPGDEVGVSIVPEEVLVFPAADQ
jgi:hypothetical protein